MAEIHDFDPPLLDSGDSVETIETRRGYDWRTARGPWPQEHQGAHWLGVLTEDCPGCDEIWERGEQ